MGKTVVSADGRFECDADKDQANLQKHGFSFVEILEVFDDPAFFEGYDAAHSITEERYFGMGCLNNTVVIIAFYTERNHRTRIICPDEHHPKIRMNTMIISKKLTPERLEEIKNFPVTYDEDCPELTAEQIRQMKPRHPEYWQKKVDAEKVPVAPEIDADVWQWFQQSGREYQSRINAVLRQAMLTVQS